MIANAVDLSGIQSQPQENKPEPPKGVYKTAVGSAYFKQPGKSAPAPAPKRSKPKKAPAPAPAPAPKYDDFTILDTNDGDRIEELKQMEIAINNHQKTQQAAQPISEPKKKAKKPRSEKQLAHLAKMRQKKKELADKRRAQNPPKTTRTKAVKQEKTPEEKALKAARKRKDMEEYFNQLYEQKEKVRLANKAKRRQEKEAQYKKLLSSGVLNQFKSKQPAPKASAPKPKPVPVDPHQGKKKRMRFEGGMLVEYWE